MEMNEASTSQSSSHGNITENQAASCNADQASSCEYSLGFDMNNQTTDLVGDCRNMSINLNDATQSSPSNAPKQNGARKKEHLNKLRIDMANVNRIPESIQTAPAAPTHYGITPVQNFFLRQISPLYTNSSSRYLEHLSHQPQFVLMQNVNVAEMFHSQQIAASVPPTPFLLQPYSTNFQYPNYQSAMQYNSQCNQQFFQNALQHPMLSRTFTNSHFQGAAGGQPSIPNSTFSYSQNVLSNATQNSPKQSRNRKKKETDHNEDRKFSPYLSAEEVEKGLQNNTLLEGILRINPRQFQHSYVSSTDKSEQDVLIDGVKSRNRALEGDIVVIQYIVDDSNESNNTNDEDKQKKGKVVYIKEKVHTRTCIGILKLMPDKNKQRALFIPRDHRVPRLNIPFTNWPNNFYRDAKSYENTLFLAKIEDWFDVRFAVAKLICHLGQSGDMLTETKVILAETDLDITPYGPEVQHLYPSSDYIIPEEEIKLRKDCRSMCIFSIDPYTCRDIDDAVSCEKLQNGNYEIGVHISDVSHFLSENTILDEKVAEKATTIYMVERAYHMLPDDLCMLCSLFAGVDKLAFSVFWEMTDDAQIVSHSFAKTVIHSCAQLAYDQAQAVLDNDKNAESNFPILSNGFTFKDLEERLKKLGDLSAILRNNRFESGALKIDQPKLSFHLSSANGLPESFCIYESKASHQLIEEFMLLSNITVAHRIYDDNPKLAFLRCHPSPSVYMLKQLAKSLKPMGINLEINSAGELYKSLLPYVGPDSTDKGKVMVLNMLCTKPMTRAKYFCAGGPEDDYRHYALNVPLYTHFTSPIRRYADIMVHRLLAASLQYRKLPKWGVDKVSMIAAQCNKQKYNAKKAGDLSTELYILKYIELNSPVVAEAVVVEIREKYIHVIIVSMGLNRRIFFNNDFPGVYECIKNEAGMKLSKMELTWKETDNCPSVKQTIEVFSILQVEMHKGDDMGKVETNLVRPQS